MENGATNWVSEHPYLAGSLLLGSVLLYFVFSSGSSAPAQSSSGVAGTGLSSGDFASLQAAQLQSATQLSAQQNQLDAQNYQTSAALQATQLQYASQDTANKLAAQVQLQNIVSSGQVQEQTNSTALQSVQAQIGGQVQLAGIGANENETIAGIQSQTLQDQYAQSVASQKIIADAQTQQGAQNAQTQQALAAYAASVQLAGITTSAASTDLQTTTEGNIYSQQIAATAAATHDSTNAAFQEAQNYINHLTFNLIPSGATTTRAIAAANPFQLSLGGLFGVKL